MNVARHATRLGFVLFVCRVHGSLLLFSEQAAAISFDRCKTRIPQEECTSCMTMSRFKIVFSCQCQAVLSTKPLRHSIPMSVCVTLRHHLRRSVPLPFVSARMAATCRALGGCAVSPRS